MTSFCVCNTFLRTNMKLDLQVINVFNFNTFDFFLYNYNLFLFCIIVIYISLPLEAIVKNVLN